MHPKIKELIDKGIIGHETYYPKRTGGQIAGMPQMGYRIWMEKNDDFPSVDIRINIHRSQHRNRELALILFELALGL